MSEFTDSNPFMPYNSFDRDNPSEPWNNPMYRDDPFAPWNNPLSTERDLEEYKKEKGLQ